jgi:hypothetical protein
MCGRERRVVTGQGVGVRQTTHMQQPVNAGADPRGLIGVHHKHNIVALSLKTTNESNEIVDTLGSQIHRRLAPSSIDPFVLCSN